MSELRLEVNSSAVSAELASIQRRLMNPQVLMRGISVELLSLTEAAFAKEGDGEKWPKLALSTIRRREKKGQWPGKMLQVSAGGQAGRGRKVTIPARPYLPMRMNGTDLELTPKASESILGLMRDLVDGKLG